MKFIVLFGMLLAAACVPKMPQSDPTEHPTVEQVSQMEVEQVVLPNLGPAPELRNEIWLNSSQPLRLAELGGKVVLIDMWTFG